MSGIVEVFPGHQFNVSGAIETVTLPKLNALGAPSARVGENQITYRELATNISEEIGDLRVELDEEIDSRITADNAFLSWQQTLEASYGPLLANIETTFTTQAGLIQDNADDIGTANTGIAANASAITALTASTDAQFTSITNTLSAYADDFGNLETYWAIDINVNGVITGRVQLNTTQDAGSATPVSSFTVAADVIRFAAPDDTESGEIVTADNGTGAVTFDASVTNGSGSSQSQLEEGRIRYGARLVINTGVDGAQIALADVDPETNFNDAGVSGFLVNPLGVLHKNASSSCYITGGAMSLSGSSSPYFITLDGPGRSIYIGTDLAITGNSGAVKMYASTVEADSFDSGLTTHARLSYNSGATTIDFRNSGGLQASINGGGYVDLENDALPSDPDFSTVDVGSGTYTVNLATDSIQISTNLVMSHSGIYQGTSTSNCYITGGAMSLSGSSSPNFITIDGPGRAIYMGTVKVLGTQGAAVSDASVAHALSGTYTASEIEDALDALGTVVNTIISRLEGHGIIAA